MRHECAVRPEDLGPYLLGQLAPDEGVLVAEAVDSCASCTAEVERLQLVVQALARTTASLEEPAPPAPAPAFDRVLATVHGERLDRRRRRHRRIGLVAAALVLVVAAGVGAVARSMSGNDAAAGRDVALTGTRPAAGSVEVSERRWGTALTLEVRGLTPGKSYGAWLADGSGERVGAGTFRPTADGSARVELAAALRLPDADTVGVTELGGDDVLRASLGRRAS
jgi:anti-sigma factor RsiW